MQSNDPFILAAMNGQELTNGAELTKSVNEEPTAFFFVLFGLVYEALASSSDSEVANSVRQSTVISALQTLKCLVRPEYSGKAILEPTIFDEFISVSYRVAMTEDAAVQIYLVEMLTVFAATQEKMDEGWVLSSAITDYLTAQ